MKVIDIRLTEKPDGTTAVTPVNALGARVAKFQLPGHDFAELGVPVTIKMPLDCVKLVLRGRGARFSATA